MIVALNLVEHTRLREVDREHLWSGLERTYREVRDFELMRLDVGGLVRRSSGLNGNSSKTSQS